MTRRPIRIETRVNRGHLLVASEKFLGLVFRQKLDARNFWRNPSSPGPLFSRNVHVVLKGAPGNGGRACRVRSAAGIRTSASVAGKGTASTKSVMEIRSSALAYLTRGAKPASAAACMQVK